MAQNIDWEKIRKHWWSDADPPSNWESDVKPISLEGLSLLGINRRTGRLYWDGKEILIKRIISLGFLERCAIVFAALATVGLFVIEFLKAWKAVCA